MHKYYVDRIEENTVVVELDKEFIELPVSVFPDGIREGDILVKNENGIFELDKEETEKVKSELFELQNSLFAE